MATMTICFMIDPVETKSSIKEALIGSTEVPIKKINTCNTKYGKQLKKVWVIFRGDLTPSDSSNIRKQGFEFHVIN